MSELWKSWIEVKKICLNKTVVLFGRSEDWVPKTIPKLSAVENLYIVDSNQVYEGTEFCGLKIFSPSKIELEDRNRIFIIITAGPYESVAEQLIEMGYESGRHFCCTPEIRDWGLLQDIREYDQNLIVVCSDYSEKGKKRYSKMGGGIYLCNTLENTFENKASGHFRQIVEIDDVYYVVEFVEKKVHVYSKDFKELEVIDTDQTKNQSEKPNGSGIAYHPDKKLIFLANTGSDTINIYAKDGFKLLETIHFSEKFEKYGDGQHHVNDCTVVGDMLLVSYFSYSGNWKKGIMDGGVSEFDLNDINKEPKECIADLWMPHSPEYIDGSICVLDSMRGELLIGNKKVAGVFPGFARGLTYDGRFYYVGQSEDMYMSRLFGTSDNIMCNAGVYLFDISNKVSRFYSFPFIMNVHDLHIWK